VGDTTVRNIIVVFKKLFQWLSKLSRDEEKEYQLSSSAAETEA